MGRKIRIQDADHFYHVSNTCHAREFLFVPGKKMNDIFKKRLRDAVRIYKVQLLAAVCMGNHYHLIVRAPNLNLHLFMGYFQGLLARDVNKLRSREESTVFPRRYSAEAILDEAALRRLMAYVVLNPVRASIVNHPDQYPGYSSWDHRLQQDAVSPTLTVPPMWQGLTPEELEQEWEQLIENELERLLAQPKRKVMGSKRARELKHWQSPKRRRRTRGKKAPRAHASTIAAWRVFVEVADEIESTYREAASTFRTGAQADFPYGTVPPGHVTCACDASSEFPKQFRLAGCGIPISTQVAA